MKKILLFFVAVLAINSTAIFCNPKSSYRSNVEIVEPVYLVRTVHNRNSLRNDVMSTKNKVVLAAFGMSAIGIIGYVAAQVI